MQEHHRHLYTANQVREFDRRAIEVHGISGYELMQRAARACWRVIRGRCEASAVIVIVCGPGNNGGDGYEIARLAMREGHVTHVYSLGAVPQHGEAALAYAAWCKDGGRTAPCPEVLPDADWLVDALFGTGLARPLSDDARIVVRSMAAARTRGARLLAVDVPSGLDATTGSVPSGVAVEADVTVSFIGRKIGVHTGRGPALAGECHFDDLAVPAATYDASLPVARLQSTGDLQAALPRRARDAHKGRHGHVLLVGGNHGMLGAVLMAGRAALRAGAGLVSVATRGAHASTLAAVQPELMAHGCDDARQLRERIDHADVIAVGPGLGTDAWARELLATVLDSGKPLIIDADALNLLAADGPGSAGDAILTPHPGEAGRLLGCSAQTVQDDRLAALSAIERRFGAVVVLKGAGTLVSGRGEAPMLCPYGNPGMAVGGMGDVLTGVIAAFRGQGLAGDRAAQLGVLAHALAGDRAAVCGERGLLPSDLVDALRAVVNPDPR